MTRKNLFLLAFISPLAIASQESATTKTGYCIPAASVFVPTKKVSTKDDEVIVESDKADLKKNELAEFNGAVVIHQEQQTIKADSAIFNEKTNQFIAQGNVELNSETATVSGESILIDEANKEFELQQAKYQLGFNAGRGEAGSFAITDNSELVLTDATFTTCPGEDPSWLMESSEISISQEAGWGEAWNTTLQVGDIPVLWVPYITFPITDERKSGLLFPKFGSSSIYGSYYSQPIYFNLALITTSP